MRRMKVMAIFLLIIILVIMITNIAAADSLWPDDNSSLYAVKPRTFKVGDLWNITFGSTTHSSSSGRGGSPITFKAPRERTPIAANSSADGSTHGSNARKTARESGVEAADVDKDTGMDYVLTRRGRKPRRRTRPDGIDSSASRLGPP